MMDLYLERNHLEPLSLRDLRCDINDFWRRQSAYVDPLETEVIDAFCKHQVIADDQIWLFSYL